MVEGLDMALYSERMETDRLKTVLYSVRLDMPCSAEVAVESGSELLETSFVLGFLLDGWNAGAAGLTGFSTRLRFQPDFWLKNGSVLLVY